MVCVRASCFVGQGTAVLLEADGSAPAAGDAKQAEKVEVKVETAAA